MVRSCPVGAALKIGPNGSGTTLTGLLLVTGVGCTSPASLTEGLAPALTKELYSCDRLEAPERDWCALTTLMGGAGTGREAYEVCRRIGDLETRDRCLALAVSREDDPAPAELCEYARASVWRSWCWSSAARRLAREQDTSAAALACAHSGPMSASCAAGVLDTRVSIWQQGTPVDLASDVGRLLAEAPRLAYDQELGAAAGRTGRTVGLLDRRQWVCDAFPSGTGKMACEVALMEGGSRQSHP